MILERRSRTLLELSQELPRAGDPESYWACAVEVFSRNSKDVPFALFYSIETDSNIEDLAGTNATTDSQYQCTLRRSIGLLGDSLADLQRLDLRQDYGIIKFFKQAVFANKPIPIDLTHESEAPQLAKVLQSQSSGGTWKSGVICPLHPPSSNETVLGFMVLGLSR